MKPGQMERVRAEEEFTRCLAVLDFTPTIEILEEIRDAVMSGVEPMKIKNVLQQLTMAQRLR